MLKYLIIPGCGLPLKVSLNLAFSPITVLIFLGSVTKEGIV